MATPENNTLFSLNYQILPKAKQSEPKSPNYITELTSKSICDWWDLKLRGIKGELHLPPKISMFCALSQINNIFLKNTIFLWP